MNLQINIAEMRKRTEIEHNLLEQINLELCSCKDDLKNIYLTQKLIPFEHQNQNNSKFTDITKIFDSYNVCLDNQNKIVEKLFAHVEQTYYAFQYFYLKKRDFMGMNLTGLIDGKIETGLGFRKCLEKLSKTTIKSKYPELLEIYEPNDYDMWKIKSDTFGWEDYGLEIFTNIIVTSKSKDNTFYLLVEKN
jgi:hypothetical protein